MTQNCSHLPLRHIHPDTKTWGFVTLQIGHPLRRALTSGTSQTSSESAAAYQLLLSRSIFSKRNFDARMAVALLFPVHRSPIVQEGYLFWRKLNDTAPFQIELERNVGVILCAVVEIVDRLLGEWSIS